MFSCQQNQQSYQNVKLVNNLLVKTSDIDITDIIDIQCMSLNSNIYKTSKNIITSYFMYKIIPCQLKYWFSFFGNIGKQHKIQHNLQRKGLKRRHFQQNNIQITIDAISTIISHYISEISISIYLSIFAISISAQSQLKDIPKFELATLRPQKRKTCSPVPTYIHIILTLYLMYYLTSPNWSKQKFTQNGKRLQKIGMQQNKFLEVLNKTSGSILGWHIKNHQTIGKIYIQTMFLVQFNLNSVLKFKQNLPTFILPRLPPAIFMKRYAPIIMCKEILLHIFDVQKE
eukprot:TRINITY_DN17591_c0_g1_i1.p1 TRINITY_DN17591_c0_g1~~TRINITY_DN17591_c0_g1_i1.p1  ORF type:complete len:286 (-),score=-11.85 TRINITY_DN17591_c0_g1_i1:400-1257(-)